jgi:hypothetical protein
MQLRIDADIIPLDRNANSQVEFRREGLKKLSSIFKKVKLAHFPFYLIIPLQLSLINVLECYIHYLNKLEMLIVMTSYPTRLRMSFSVYFDTKQQLYQFTRIMAVDAPLLIRHSMPAPKRG